MITSHQNRIEQLRESFKEKLADSERWEEKVFLPYTGYCKSVIFASILFWQTALKDIFASLKICK